MYCWQGQKSCDERMYKIEWTFRVTLTKSIFLFTFHSFSSFQQQLVLSSLTFLFSFIKRLHSHFMGENKNALLPPSTSDVTAVVLVWEGNGRRRKGMAQERRLREGRVKRMMIVMAFRFSHSIHSLTSHSFIDYTFRKVVSWCPGTEDKGKFGKRCIKEKKFISSSFRVRLNGTFDWKKTHFYPLFTLFPSLLISFICSDTEHPHSVFHVKYQEKVGRSKKETRVSFIRSSFNLFHCPKPFHIHVCMFCMHWIEFQRVEERGQPTLSSNI